VLEHLAEITTIDPAAADWAADEMIGLVFGRIAETLSEKLAERSPTLNP
jgi:hypothetical protein